MNPSSMRSSDSRKAVRKEKVGQGLRRCHGSENAVPPDQVSQ